MITETRDDRFINYILEVAKWFRFYTFNQINKYTYKQEVEVLEKVYRYLSLFKNNIEVVNYFKDFLKKDNNRFSNLTEIINSYLK